MAKTLSSVCRRECEWCILELGFCLPMAMGRKTPLLFDHLDTLDKLARVDALDSSNFKLARVPCIELSVWHQSVAKTPLVDGETAFS